MRAVRVRGRHFNGRQPSGLNKNNLDCGISLLLGGGLVRGIKIPQQDFELKMPGELMREGGGGVFAGHYGTYLYTAMYLVSKAMQAKNTDLFLTWSLMGGNTPRGGSRAMNIWRWVWPLDFFFINKLTTL